MATKSVVLRNPDSFPGIGWEQSCPRAKSETAQSSLEFLAAVGRRLHTCTARAKKVFSCCAWLKETLGNISAQDKADFWAGPHWNNFLFLLVVAKRQIHRAVIPGKLLQAMVSKPVSDLFIYFGPVLAYCWDTDICQLNSLRSPLNTDFVFQVIFLQVCFIQKIFIPIHGIFSTSKLFNAEFKNSCSYFSVRHLCE